MMLLWIALFLWNPVTSIWAAPATVYSEFISACTKGFAPEVSETGLELCTCAAHESKHQKVSPERLARETAEIRKNPKYQIQDKGVLASLHYCTVQMMQNLEPEGQRHK